MTLPLGLPQSVMKFSVALIGVSWTDDDEVRVERPPNSPSNCDESKPFRAFSSSGDVLRKIEPILSEKFIRTKLEMSVPLAKRSINEFANRLGDSISLTSYAVYAKFHSLEMCNMECDS